jgi:hypothetical protein
MTAQTYEEEKICTKGVGKGEGGGESSEVEERNQNGHNDSACQFGTVRTTRSSLPNKLVSPISYQLDPARTASPDIKEITTELDHAELDENSDHGFAE